MPLEGRQLAAPVDLRDLLRVGLDTEPDAVAMSSATDRITWRELELATDRLARNYVALGLDGGRPRRVADAEPHPARRALPRVLPGGTRHHTTQLPLRAAARSTTRSRSAARRAIVAHAERADDLAASALAGGAAADRARGASRRRPHARAAVRRRSRCGRASRPHRAAPRRRSSSRPAAPVRPRASPTASTRSAGWSASAVDGFELTDADTFLPGSSMSHVGSFLWALASLSVGAHVVVARHVRRRRDPPVAPRPPTHDPGHDPGRAHRARPRPRRHRRTTSRRCALCRAGADKVSLELEHEFQALERLAHRRGLRHDRGRARHAQPAAWSDQAGLDRPAVGGFAICVRDDDAASAATGTVGRVWIRTAQPDHRVLGQPGGDRRDPARRLARLRRPRPRRRRRLPLVLRPQEADHRARRLEHQPGEVEEALAEHPAVALVGVVGIHDEVHGENVRAYVTIQDGAERPTSHDLIEFARERIGYKAPEEVVFLDEMPVNPTGKLDRVALKALGRGPPAPARTPGMIELALFDTPIGRCGIAVGGRPHRRYAAAGAAGCRHPTTTARPLRRPVGRGRRGHATARDRGRDRANGRVTPRRGRRPGRRAPRSRRALPPFRRKVFEVVRTIPAGETLSYGDVALAVGSPGAARAVGQALGRNPFPIVIPCHRVLAAGGRIGGFTAEGGVSVKEKMLAAEGVFHTRDFARPQVASLRQVCAVRATQPLC